MSTIAAISTATGNGGIGIVRMSGKKCFEVLDKIFKPINDSEIQGYSIKYGYIIDPKTNEKIDEVLVSYFKAPKSYTTENMCEINSHGGIVVEKMILQLCLENGADLAEPGEFTKRAFLNGRLDLAQAESVIDLINAKTNNEAKASINQLEGKLSKKIKEIRNKILDSMADIEANIDYPEYDIEETTNKKIMNVLEEVKKELQELYNTFEDGKILKEGVKTIIIGKPNAGKSSLLNSILKEERAIVSEYAGTTRDTIEEFVNIKGITLKLIDTAGIRKTEDKIEEIGVNRALKLSNEADLIIAIFDASKELDNEDIEILNILENKKSIIILNKTDLGDINLEKNNLINKYPHILKMSVKNDEGIDNLYNVISDMFKINEISMNDGVIVVNMRHKSQIKKAIESTEESMKTCREGFSIDIVSIPMKQILHDLASITGEDVSEDIINKIFAKFCLGK
ncbi:MAG: tRNA uridine-5-carboxymethylaminomethyl(34) synthesis GTPase MnmE [Clostridiales bacterium]|nr:tRNA uridine-5-carboxymethylaminomethyl(34) synthesis GTPase MnmE [Clostridiales bacterium]